MTETSGYNGWKNYETWNVSLWLDNEPATYEGAREIVAQAFDDDPEYPRVTAADALRDYVGGMLPDLGASFAADLLGHAFAQVEWFEIVDAIRSES